MADVSFPRLGNEPDGKQKRGQKPREQNGLVLSLEPRLCEPIDEGTRRLASKVK